MTPGDHALPYASSWQHRASPTPSEYAWARRLGLHINRPPKRDERDRLRRLPIVSVRVETLASPARYAPGQIERARRVAAGLQMGRLVLCERPASASPETDNRSTGESG